MMNKLKNSSLKCLKILLEVYLSIFNYVYLVLIIQSKERYYAYHIIL